MNTFARAGAGVAVGFGVAVGLGTRRRQWMGRTLICLLNNLCNKATKRINTKAQHVVIDHYVLHNC